MFQKIKGKTMKINRNTPPRTASKLFVAILFVASANSAFADNSMSLPQQIEYNNTVYTESYVTPDSEGPEVGSTRFDNMITPGIQEEGFKDVSANTDVTGWRDPTQMNRSERREYRLSVERPKQT